MNTRFFKFAKAAMKKADYSKQQSTHYTVKIGGVAVYKGSIIAEAWNTNRTSPLQKKYNVLRRPFSKETPSKTHCETMLVQKIRWKKGNEIKWDKVEIYLYRETKDGKLATCRPCPGCFQMLKDYGIKYVYYTTDQGYVKEKLVK